MTKVKCNETDCVNNKDQLCELDEIRIFSDQYEMFCDNFEHVTLKKIDESIEKIRLKATKEDLEIKMQLIQAYEEENNNGKE